MEREIALSMALDFCKEYDVSPERVVEAADIFLAFLEADEIED